jgi:hypothetical protein
METAKSHWYFEHVFNYLETLTNGAPIASAYAKLHRMPSALAGNTDKIARLNKQQVQART